ncbi:MAG: hypothetical protein AAF639_03255 [Chloroflexota bacterium]
MEQSIVQSMEQQKVRFKFRCWSCEEVYALWREIQGNPKLLVQCPHCMREAVVDLMPYRDSTEVTYRSANLEMPQDDEQSETPGEVRWDFPDILPTERVDD